MSFKDYSTTPANNTEIGDELFIGPNMPRNDVRPALQQLAADGRELYDEMLSQQTTLVGNINSIAAALLRLFPSRAAGEAGSTTDQLFSAPNDQGAIVSYRKTLGGSVVIGQSISPDSPTITGSPNFVTNGNPVSITNGASAFDGSNSVLNVYNSGAAPTGLRLISYFTGSAADPLENNDTSLFNTFTKTVDASTNLTWTISAPNCYNWIPAGVRDGGERVAVYGWATSVPNGSYVHAGTLCRQIGGRFSAGFQGYHTQTGAIVEEAWCVDARLIRETAGTTIEQGTGVVVRCELADLGDGASVLDYIGVHVRHAPGQNSNYSFKGDAGLLWNSDIIESDTAVVAPSYQMAGSDILDRDGNYNRVYRPDGGVGLYLGNATDPLNVYHNTTHSFQNRSSATQVTINDSGVNTAGAFFVDSDQVVGNRGAAVADATDAASAITQLNLLLARLRTHGLIAS